MAAAKPEVILFRFLERIVESKFQRPYTCIIRVAPLDKVKADIRDIDAH
jgi:hypothetical protein